MYWIYFMLWQTSKFSLNHEQIVNYLQYNAFNMIWAIYRTYLSKIYSYKPSLKCSCLSYCGNSCWQVLIRNKVNVGEELAICLIYDVTAGTYAFVKTRQIVNLVTYKIPSEFFNQLLLDFDWFSLRLHNKMVWLVL